MRNFRFFTKADTLERLSGKLSKGKVLPLYRLSIEEFRSQSDNAFHNIQENLASPFLIVRSSASDEDAVDSSQAGHYLSVQNVPSASPGELRAAIQKVIDSYGSHSKSKEVLLQPMLENIMFSGVVFTADIDTLAPYYRVNYDESGKGDSVESGQTGDFKTYIRFKDSPFPCLEPDIQKVINACRELEEVTGNNCLDIEFAVDDAGDVYIFQCRPIVTKNKENLSAIDLRESLWKIYRKIEKLMIPHPNLMGKRTMFGVMPDWNPAEMIGLKPQKLTLSLYKELITDSVWAYQRSNYGYRNLRSHPLLISFLGTPFIDVRVDFNSFIPKGLNDRIANKLFDFYLNKLERLPNHHDKVEFEIVHSCYHLSLPEKLRELLLHGFDESEIKRIEYSLLEITNAIIDPENGLFRKDLKRLETLKEKTRSVLDSQLPLLEKIYWLTEDCKRYGTLPFAGIARAAFIGVQFLKSFVEGGIMTQEEHDSFMNSLNTISRKLSCDLGDVAGGAMTREEFLTKYGHLRPKTYDILSPRYDENFEQYFPFLNRKKPCAGGYRFSSRQLAEIGNILAENGLNADARTLIAFIQEAITGREYAKFVFTRSISEILRFIEILGEKSGFKRDEMAHVSISTILGFYSTLDARSVSDVLREEIANNRDAFEYTKAIQLPSLIMKPEDVYDFFLEAGEPNFVTLENIEGHVVRETDIHGVDIERKIVLIKSADPGYDFLFANKIAGLVTQFGGANSHMAIRCAEASIPAVIGAGERNFTEWSKAQVLGLDCVNKQVRVIL